MNIFTSYMIVFVVFVGILGAIIYFLDPILRRLLYNRRNKSYVNSQDSYWYFPDGDFSSSGDNFGGGNGICGDGGGSCDS